MTSAAEWIDEGSPAHEPTLTPEEWQAIRDEIWSKPWDDMSLFPACLREAVRVLGEIGTSNTDNPARTATQCLRAMAYRAKTGVPFNEPQEPAWSLDSERRMPR